MKPIIEVQHLTLSHLNKQDVLRDINLALKPDYVLRESDLAIELSCSYALLWRNSSSKFVLLKILAFTREPRQGAARVLDLGSLRLRKLVFDLLSLE